MNRFVRSFIVLLFSLLTSACSASNQSSTQGGNLKILTNKDFRGSVENFKNSEQRSSFVDCMTGKGLTESVAEFSTLWREAAMSCLSRIPDSSGTKIWSRSEWITNNFNTIMLEITQCLTAGNAKIKTFLKDEIIGWVAIEPLPKGLEDKCDEKGQAYADSHPYKVLEQ
jgi:hypothetical protein